MATIRWYLTNSVDANGWQALTQTSQTSATLTAGWVVSTGSTNSSEHNSGAATDRAATTFVGNTVPDGTLDTSLKDAFRTPALIGTFANANWTFQFAVIATVTGGTAPSGQMVFRLIKANADGSSPTLIAASQQSASICTSIGSTAINGTLTFNPGAITLTAGQYLFVQCAWKRTGAGSMTTHNTRLRTGNSSTVGTTILSSDFTPGDQAVTTQPIASTSALNLPTVINTKLVTTDTIPVGSAAITGHVLTPVVSGRASTRQRGCSIPRRCCLSILGLMETLAFQRTPRMEHQGSITDRLSLGIQVLFQLFRFCCSKTFLRRSLASI